MKKTAGNASPPLDIYSTHGLFLWFRSQFGLSPQNQSACVRSGPVCGRAKSQPLFFPRPPVTGYRHVHGWSVCLLCGFLHVLNLFCGLEIKLENSCRLFDVHGIN